MKEIKEHGSTEGQAWSPKPMKRLCFNQHRLIRKNFSPFFLYCSKEVKNTESDVTTLKIVIYAKVVENAMINFSISPYCILLCSRKESRKFFEVV